MILFNYFDFLLEGAEVPREIAKMKIYYSDRFRDLLSKIASNKSKDNETARMIAEYLLAGEDSNQALDIYTLIDITEKNDKISFVQVNRIARDTGLKNLTAFKVGPDYKFWKDGRTPEYGIGRWVRHIFVDVQKTTLEDTKLELFVNAYKSVFDSKDKELVEVVDGEEIRNCYLYSNYSEIKGQLGNSCMRYDRCQKYLDIYVKNPEVCKLLVLRDDNGKVRGRALLWTLSDGKRYIDRMYTIDDSDKNIFKDWGAKNGITKHYDNVGNVGGEVHLKNLDFSKYPYMDTFVFYDDQNGVLSEDNMDNSLKLQDTQGGYESNEGQVRDIDGDWIDEDDARWCEDVDGWVYYESTYWLEYRDIYVSDRCDVEFSEFHNEYFETRDVYKNEETEDWYYPEYSSDIMEYYVKYDQSGPVVGYIPKSYKSFYFFSKKKFEVDGEYYSVKNYIKDPYTDEYHFRNEIVDGQKFEVYLDSKIKEELNLPDRFRTTAELKVFQMDFLDQLINMPESKEVKKKIKELRDGFKSSLNVRGSAYKNFDKPWYYYLPIIFYCIKEAKVMGENITYLGNNKSSVIDIVDKMKYKKSEKKDIKDWLEERLGNLYNRPNIFSLTSQINPTLFGDEVYKKYLYLSF
jgi:hypothetical protein